MAKFDADVLKNQVLALVMNVWSWLLTWLPPFLRRAGPPLPLRGEEAAVQIAGPGGLDRLQAVRLGAGAGGAAASAHGKGGGSSVCVGYNVEGFPPPYVSLASTDDIPRDAVVLSNRAFSINYADVTIRWGLYEVCIL